MLDSKYNICCSQTSACTKGRPEPSHVLIAMGCSEEEAYGSIRFSFSILNTVAEVEYAAEKVCECYHQQKYAEKEVFKYA